MKCVFCESPEIQTRMIFRNALVWAFPTNIPIVPGHVIVAPVRCVKTFEELSTKETRALLDLSFRLKKALANIFSSEGFNYAWNEGLLAGQSVPHLHLHILPRKEGDTGVIKYEPRQFLYRPRIREKTAPESELLEVAQLIRKNLFL